MTEERKRLWGRLYSETERGWRRGVGEEYTVCLIGDDLEKVAIFDWWKDKE